MRELRPRGCEDISQSIGEGAVPVAKVGDLPAATDPAQAACALEAVATGITPARMLHGDADVAAWALRTMRVILGAAE